MELYSFLRYNYSNYINEYHCGFPSPYGVIFILTIVFAFNKLQELGFPSPYGVIFILTGMEKAFEACAGKSFRLLMELYSFLRK